MRCFGVAAASGHRGAQQSFRVVLDLLHLGVVDFAELRNHMGRAGVAAGAMAATSADSSR